MVFTLYITLGGHEKNVSVLIFATNVFLDERLCKFPLLKNLNILIFVLTIFSGIFNR
jgi:hypothetical protein